RVFRPLPLMPALCSSARCALLAALLCATTALAADPLRTVAAIRALAHDEAARGLPVKVEGVVTYFNAPQIEMMLHDGHDGLYVLLPKQLDGLPQFAAGDQVLVEGVTQPGEFVPLISLSRLSVLGKGKMPEPHRIIEGELFSPDLDCQWVETPAVVVGAENRKNGVFTLTVEASGHPVPVKIPWTSDAISRAAELMQRPVMVRGSAGAIFNKQRQLTGRVLFVE
ncbi:MAG TPA: sensor histidine kinase, partial [Chthoniobacteraceae bacterium]